MQDTKQPFSQIERTVFFFIWHTAIQNTIKPACSASRIRPQRLSDMLKMKKKNFLRKFEKKLDKSCQKWYNNKHTEKVCRRIGMENQVIRPWQTSYVGFDSPFHSFFAQLDNCIAAETPAMLRTVCILRAHSWDPAQQEETGVWQKSLETKRCW